MSRDSLTLITAQAVTLNALSKIRKTFNRYCTAGSNWAMIVAQRNSADVIGWRGFIATNEFAAVEKTLTCKNRVAPENEFAPKSRLTVKIPWLTF